MVNMETKEEFIESVKKYTDDYINNPSYKDEEWEHYSNKAWGEIYDIGNVYHTDQLIIGEKYSETRKMVADNEWFVNWVKEEFERAKKQGIDIELHILGAIIQKNITVNVNDFERGDGGWIRYIKLRK